MTTPLGHSSGHARNCPEPLVGVLGDNQVGGSELAMPLCHEIALVLDVDCTAASKFARWFYQNHPHS